MFPALKSRTHTPRTLSSIARRAMTNNQHRPANWKELAPPPLPGPTFAAQDKLPKLPVPELSETLAKLKDSLKPMAKDENEWNKVTQCIEDFGRESGPKLQELLKQRAQEKSHWLEEWWDDLGYLGYRDSVVVNVSYYYGFKDHPAHLPQESLNRAAHIVRATMLFRQQFKLGQVKPEATKEGPICMDTWRWMFDCCRIPGQEGLDWSHSYAKPGDDGTSGHIVVFRKGRVWRLDPWQNGRLLSIEELQQQLKAIVDGTTKEYPSVSVMTASNRDVWAKDYAALVENPRNAEIIETIQSAAFVLSLDDYQPDDIHDFSQALWHGGMQKKQHEHAHLGLRNRWVDKPVQFIVYDNGKAGIMGEHSVMDGTPTVALCDAVLDMIADPHFDQGTPGGAPPAPPQAYDWALHEGLTRALVSANAKARILLKNQNLRVVRTPYGKAAIKRCGVSPDSWAQLLVQLAYARVLARAGKKRAGGTYEAAMTRRFFKGRTEAIRVVTPESDAWVASMDDPAATREQRRALFAAAAQKHVRLAKEAGQGRGVDRHLLGLKLINGELAKQAKAHPEQDTPEAKRARHAATMLFDNAVYKRSSHWVLSTSAVWSKHFGPYGWGEVVPDGFGVAYMTGFDDYLQYTVTSRTEMPNRTFCAALQRAAAELHELLADAPPAPKANL
ncbi:choline/carnitine O-acyltransferase [Phanerochaete sordida]|uniref:Choline/carnitine O-acyltransferase n=1 Tax=Phanerochaete sordida TaxID=48140 RepID=A0A9P3GFB8_9APHY|nr:choline/carnitine O-acyltransferase [Phanerochaete sordida]